MPFTNHFVSALLVTFICMDYATATYMIHSSCNGHPLVKQAIEAAGILASDGSSRLSTRPWSHNDRTQREYSQYAKWLFGDDGTAPEQQQPAIAPAIPKGPRTVDPRGYLDKLRDYMSNIEIVLSNEAPFPSQRTTIREAQDGIPALTSYYPSIPHNGQVFYCDETRLGPPINPDPTNPRRGYQLDGDFQHQVPLGRSGIPGCYTGVQAFNYCTSDFCITQICPDYLKFIENAHQATQDQIIYDVPAIDGRLQLEELKNGEAEIDFYKAFGAVILHEMTHTLVGGMTGDLLGYDWFDIRSAGVWGIRNADNHIYWVLAAKLADNNNLYTHWDGKVDNNPNDGEI